MTPAVILSGNAGLDDALFSILGRAAFVPKPFGVDALQRTMSALFDPPAARDPLERRAHPRVGPDGVRSITIEEGVLSGAFLQPLDLSEGGAALGWVSPVPKGLELSLRVEHHDLDLPVRKKAQVRWVTELSEPEDYAYQVGVSFIGHPAI